MLNNPAQVSAKLHHLRHPVPIILTLWKFLNFVISLYINLLSSVD